MGWSSQFFTLIVIEGPNAAILLYSPTAGPGNLIGSWAAVGYTDQYGNVIPQGINVNQGVLNSVSIVGAAITASTITQTLITASTIISPTLSAGTIYETTITFDTGGGMVLGYTSSTTTVTQTANGNYNFTAPAGVTNAKVECWGAGAGGGGGNNAGNGGSSGGAGEYAQEPSYPLIPGNVYAYTVGNGGNGGTTNGNGSNGSDSFFDTNGVYANGGDASPNHSTGGAGGTGSSNTIHFDGGTGGTTTSSGGASGPNSGNSTAKGNNGVNSTTSSGAAAPAAQTGSGHGGAGGNNLANGVNGGSPGAGGSGCGASSGSGGAFSQTFNCTSSRSYYGADASNGNPNGTRNSNGTVWQGGETATGGGANGTQKCVMLFSTSAIQAACVGVTVSEVDFTITNEHSWYGSGMTLQIKEWLASQGGSLPGSWNGLGSPVITQQNTAEGVRKTFQFFTNTSAPTDFPNGTAIGIALGPGPSAFDLSFYGYFNGTPNSSSGPQLTIIGTKGSGFNTAGNGSDGKVSITYSSSSTIVFALSPQSGTDASGNAYAMGYTGPVSAFQPGVSPAVVEVPHLASLGAAYSNQSGAIRCQYWLDSENNVHIIGVIQTTGAWTTTLFTLPTGYRPSAQAFVPCAIFPVADGNAYMTVNTNGSITLSVPAAATALVISGQFPLGIT
jgi:hypothetical protein